MDIGSHVAKYLVIQLLVVKSILRMMIIILSAEVYNSFKLLKMSGRFHTRSPTNDGRLFQGGVGKTRDEKVPVMEKNGKTRDSGIRDAYVTVT